jgi:hypothetical protein
MMNLVPVRHFQIAGHTCNYLAIKKAAEFLHAVLWCISQPIHIVEH